MQYDVTNLSCHLVILVVLKVVFLEHHIHLHPLSVGAPVREGGEGVECKLCRCTLEMKGLQ